MQIRYPKKNWTYVWPMLPDSRNYRTRREQSETVAAIQNTAKSPFAPPNTPTHTTQWAKTFNTRHARSSSCGLLLQGSWYQPVTMQWVVLSVTKNGKTCRPLTSAKKTNKSPNERKCGTSFSLTRCVFRPYNNYFTPLGLNSVSDYWANRLTLVFC